MNYPYGGAALATNQLNVVLPDVRHDAAQQSAPARLCGTIGNARLNAPMSMEAF
jgi:hypothetical protein